MLSILEHTTPKALLEIEEEMRVRGTRGVFLLFGMGSQFDHLIKLALGKLGVFCLVANAKTVTREDVEKLKPIGIILSGGPASVHAEPPHFDNEIFDIGIPVLGICLGFQMWPKHVGVNVTAAEKREFGVHEFTVSTESLLFEGLPKTFKVMESHGDRVEYDPRMTVLGSTENTPVSAGQMRHLWGVQFHPEVTHTENGLQILDNFCFKICRAKDRFPAEKIAEKKIKEIRERVGDSKVLLALSGGSDSSTVAYILKEAFKGKPRGQVRGVYIRGVDRPEDEKHVREYFGNQDWIELVVVDATEEFLAALKGKFSMKEKRAALKVVYERILERELQKFGASFIAQGTLYTDISESGGGISVGARKAQIKSHHNVGLTFSVPELTPLDDCVKDGGRNIGRAIGVPEILLVRHPFPGPGLILRIIGEVTREKLAIARAIDGIYIEELRTWELYEAVWQAGAVVTDITTTTSKGDDAGEGLVVLLWAVTSVDGFTADWARLDYDFLDKVSKRITNEVPEAGSVTYRISGKPPSTIEMG